MELRKRVRYRLGTKVEFTWKNPEGHQLKGVGVTRDISLRGVFIFTSLCPAVNTTVRLNVFLPPSQKGGTGTRIVAGGMVRRIDNPLEGDYLSGFAVTSNKF